MKVKVEDGSNAFTLLATIMRIDFHEHTITICQDCPLIEHSSMSIFPEHPQMVATEGFMVSATTLENAFLCPIPVVISRA